MHEKCGHLMDNGFIFKRINKNINIKETKKSWGPFRIYQLISIANPALFEWKWAELAVLISSDESEPSWLEPQLELKDFWLGS
jgi:hypothetical protein